MYYYYDHGPLARVEIGQNNLQGVDYYYNLQGWLKGVNSSVLLDENDPGKDSDPNSLNNFFGKDVFGFGLQYYNGDYEAIGGASTNAATSPIAPVDNASHAALNSFDLYNGNIRYMQTAIVNPTTRDAMPMLNAYNYDQLNRLKESRSYESGLSTNSWNPTSYNDEYFNAFTFDAMGNIETQNRHLRDGNRIDSLFYKYQKDGNGDLLRNRLYHINDSIASTVDATDIDDMGVFYDNNNAINTDNNYSYDAEGRLVKDRQEEIDTIIWTVSGKVKEIRRDLGSDHKNVIFDYDAMGNRIAKHIYDNEAQMLVKSTYYILDAQGNQISMYEHDVKSASVDYYLAERNIYGSSRLGTTRDTINMFLPNTLPSYGVVGNRNYELSNHLGNVLAVINDIVYPISDDSTTILSYEVGLTMVSDYSPFGVQLDGRTISNGDYRYGFNGMERDNEVKGKGNSYDFGSRMYDSRVGKFLSIDPFKAKFPHQSPYVFAGNTPIMAVDHEGDSIRIYSLSEEQVQQIAGDLQLKLGSDYSIEIKKVVVSNKTMGDSNGDGYPTVSTDPYYLVSINNNGNTEGSKLFQALNEFSGDKDLNIATYNVHFALGEGARANPLFTKKMGLFKTMRYGHPKNKDVDRPSGFPANRGMDITSLPVDVGFSWYFGKEIENFTSVSSIDLLLFSVFGEKEGITNVESVDQWKQDGKSVSAPYTDALVKIKTTKSAIQVRMTSNKGNVYKENGSKGSAKVDEE